MKYVALLRGINVGGNNKVPMATLKKTFERLGFDDVRTFIASGNVLFRAGTTDHTKLTKQIEAAIAKDFGLSISVLLRDEKKMETLVKKLPASWVNDKTMKCDVMFLWSEVDKPSILKELPFDLKIEDITYTPGAVLWRIDRDKITKSRMLKIIGTKLYKQMTVRNCNTTRKLYALMTEKEKNS